MNHPYIYFLNQTKRTCQIGLDIAAQQMLGGRDALVLANYISGKVPVMYTRARFLIDGDDIINQIMTPKTSDSTGNPGMPPPVADCVWSVMLVVNMMPAATFPCPDPET